MLHRLFTILWILSLLLFCVIAVIYAGNNSLIFYCLMDSWYIPTRVRIPQGYHPDARIEFRTEKQGLALHRFEPSPPVRGPAFATPAYVLWHRQIRQQDVDWRFCGFRYHDSSRIVLTAFPNPSNYTEFRGRDSEFTVPYWFPLAATALLPLCLFWIILKQRRVKRRLRSGLCPTCSYDLRAHGPGDLCPECGSPVRASTSVRNPDASPA